MSEDKGYCDTKISGIANKSNNADWSVRARANSYHADKAALRHDLGGEGAAKDFKSGDEPTPVRKFEGKGWAPINPAAKPNTFTGDKSNKD